MPRFSIVITCHNQAGFIADAVDSALDQRHSSKEVIVVDDHSTDGSLAVLKNYGKAIVLETSNVNGGANLARNTGASRACGDYLVFLDGDDLLMPGALDIYDRLVEAKAPKLMVGKLHFFKDAIPVLDGEQKPSKIELVEYESFLQKDRMHRQSASCIVVERDAFWRVNGWDVGLFPCEDYDLTMRAGYLGTTLQILAPATVFYRVHGENVTRDVTRIIRGIYGLIKKERDGGYPGGAAWRYQRYAIIGGAAFGWIRRALSTGCYLEAAKLFVSAGPMIAAACMRRLTTKLKRSRPIRSIDIPQNSEVLAGARR